MACSSLLRGNVRGAWISHKQTSDSDGSCCKFLYFNGWVADARRETQWILCTLAKGKREILIGGHLTDMFYTTPSLVTLTLRDIPMLSLDICRLHHSLEPLHEFLVLLF